MKKAWNRIGDIHTVSDYFMCFQPRNKHIESKAIFLKARFTDVTSNLH